MAHPKLEKSTVNSRLLQVAQQLPHLAVYDLYEDYAHGIIDEATEQARLRQTDLIVWQYPLYWYAAPSLLKEWLDATLEYGFAYGETGTELRGKYCLSVISAGGNAAAYQSTGKHGFTVWELLAPLRAMASQCGLICLPPAIIYEASRATQSLTQIEQDYRHFLQTLQQIDLSANWLCDVNFFEQVRL